MRHPFVKATIVAQAFYQQKGRRIIAKNLAASGADLALARI
jgi:hypothetical protein